LGGGKEGKRERESSDIYNNQSVLRDTGLIRSMRKFSSEAVCAAKWLASLSVKRLLRGDRDAGS